MAQSHRNSSTRGRRSRHSHQQQPQPQQLSMQMFAPGGAVMPPLGGAMPAPMGYMPQMTQAAPTSRSRSRSSSAGSVRLTETQEELYQSTLNRAYKFFGGEERSIGKNIKTLLLQKLCADMDITAAIELGPYKLDQLFYILFKVSVGLNMGVVASPCI